VMLGQIKEVIVGDKPHERENALMRTVRAWAVSKTEEPYELARLPLLQRQLQNG
jgi:hypothetical protein